MTTTLKGEELFESAAPIADAYDRFLETAFPTDRPASVKPHSVEIAISAFQGYGHECLPPLLQEYMSAHPRVSFRIYQEKSVDDLEKGVLDLFITASVVNRPTLIRYDTRLVPCILACSPGYLKQHGVPKCPEDLKHHIGLERMGANFPVSHGLLFNGRLSYQAQFGQTIFSESSIALRDSAIGGLGIVFDLPVEFMRRQIVEGRLVQVLPGWHRRPFQRSILIARDAAKRRPELERFAEWLADREREESFKREMQTFAVLQESPQNYR